MRAMVYRGPYKIRVDEKDIPPIEHPNDAIVRVTLGAICGSDLHLYHGLMPDTRVGMTFGHEFVGVVEEVGPSVRNLERGDRVMVPFNIFCGSCWYCARGLYSNCHNVNPNATAVGGIYGYSHTCGRYGGGQSEYVRVPFADVGPSIIPDWIDGDRHFDQSPWVELGGIEPPSIRYRTLVLRPFPTTSLTQGDRRVG